MRLLQLLFSTKGRVPKSMYWYAYFGLVAIFMIAEFLDSAIGTLNVRTNMFLLSLIPFFIIQIKRCHDRDRSGWFLLIYLIPVAGLVVFYELGFLNGTVGENKYGPDPLSN